MGSIVNTVCGDNHVSHELIRRYYRQEQADFREVFFSLNNELNNISYTILGHTHQSLCPALQIMSYSSFI